MKVAVFGATKVEIFPNGISRMEISNKYGDAVTLEDAQDICKFIHDENEDRITGTMIIGNDISGVRQGFGVNSEFNTNKFISKVRVAEVIVMDSIAMRLIMDFYTKLKRKRNTKVFKLEEDAREWILEQLKRDDLHTF